MQLKKLRRFLPLSSSLFLAALTFATISGGFIYTGSLTNGRISHSATLLNDGTVLVAGGQGSSGYLSSAELYNPNTGTFNSTNGVMNVARASHTATLLQNAMVLVTGGQGAGINNFLSSAELYNPSTGNFTPTAGAMNATRVYHTATLLPSGMVLITGGNGSGPTTAELYNPSTGTFTPTGTMHAARATHTATLLNNGTVLIAGGPSGSPSAEIYNPSTGSFTVTGAMNTPRTRHSATLLSSGAVLIAGGQNSSTGAFLSSAELYNPSTSSFTYTAGSLNTARWGHGAVMLSNGTALITGGCYKAIRFVGCIGTSSAEVYDPSSGTFSVTGNMNTAREGHTATTISNGMPLIVGGQPQGGNWLSSAELYFTSNVNLLIGSSQSDGSNSTFETHDDTGALLSSGTLSIPRAQHTATRLLNGHLFVAGGSQGQDTTSWQIMDQNANVLSSGLLNDQRVSSAATVLGNGNVFLAGGTNTPGTWEIHTGAGALVSSGSLLDSRGAGIVALTLQNGNIWVSGAEFGSPAGGVYEIHSPNGSLVSSGSLVNTYNGGQAQLLNNGNVILMGGDNCTGCYEIRTQTGSLVTNGSLTNSFNSGANSVLLANGNVMIFGSCATVNCNASGSGSTWEIRDQNGNFVSTGSLLDTRDTAGAALLSNGNVFITGGNAAPGAWEIRNQSGSLVSQGSLADTRGGGHSVTHF